MIELLLTLAVTVGLLTFYRVVKRLQDCLDFEDRISS